MTAIRRLLLIPGLLAMLSACGPGPEVLQGEVVRYESASKTIAIKDELPPHQEVSLSLEKAELGAEPQVGDKVRVAYRKTDDRLMVTRVMNLTHHRELGAASK